VETTNGGFSSKKKTENNLKTQKEQNLIYISSSKMKKVLCPRYGTSEGLQIGVDEVGRGPLFGRVYAAAVILPLSFDHFRMRDSKKFSSWKRLKEASDYIKANATAWSVKYEDEDSIDQINILQATQLAMHRAIADVLQQTNPQGSANMVQGSANMVQGSANMVQGSANMVQGSANTVDVNKVLLLIDGNYFIPFYLTNGCRIHDVCIKGGDDEYSAIAAASIIAKVSRDEYIQELCLANPELVTKYSIDSNKGYGSKTHIQGIVQHGITKWHRKTFGICRQYSFTEEGEGDQEGHKN
jgi:ribonuclease HII